MFSVYDIALSNGLLILATASCVYHTHKKLSTTILNFEPDLTAATVGVLAINFRSIFNFLSPLILSASRSINRTETSAREDEDKAVLRIGPLHEKLCRVISMSGLIYAVCESHENRKTGIFIVSLLSALELRHALCGGYPRYQENKWYHFLWMLAGGSFGWIKGNKYCFWAYLPYLISFLLLAPEKDLAWSVRRVVNNYMMMAHVFLMLEAVREGRSLQA
ncbi:hypothetical protein TSAR_006804 [Trichomalopsis sarcophagae]|uniref:Uncharacterized protein n=1 Tax=Trichomalopsis sarcophagae TaxID=543379 RepID=A0A232FE15_9HYME|nr:hypothetical protein TSAR_006804 [Trichomalopsis sarcophagae]